MIHINLALLSIIALLLLYIAYKSNSKEMFDLELDKRDYSDCTGDRLDRDYVRYMLDNKSLVSHSPKKPYEATCRVLSRPGNH